MSFIRADLYPSRCCDIYGYDTKLKMTINLFHIPLIYHLVLLMGHDTLAIPYQYFDVSVTVHHIQGVTGGTDQTSGGCFLC